MQFCRLMLLYTCPLYWKPDPYSTRIRDFLLHLLDPAKRGFAALGVASSDSGETRWFEGEKGHDLIRQLFSQICELQAQPQPSWLLVELANQKAMRSLGRHGGRTVARRTEGTVEPLSQGDPKARVTQAALEVASQGTPTAGLSQETVEVLSQVNPAARLSQTTLEVLSQATPPPASTRVVVEVLSSTLEASVLETQPVIFICT